MPAATSCSSRRSGSGQAEVEIASLADTTLVLLAPGMGDAIQAVKAGILEIADIFVVNKADRDGADATYRDIQGMIALGGTDRGPGDWRPRVLKASAGRGEGIDEVVGAIDDHQEWLSRTGELTRRREQRAAAEIEALVVAELRARFAELPGVGLHELAARVASGDLDPYAAATRLAGGSSPRTLVTGRSVWLTHRQLARCRGQR